MASLNKVMLIGRTTRDPEVRVTPKGTSICQFSLAVNREWKNEAGEKQEEVLFADCEAWGKAGETIGKWVTKGKELYVEGRLRLDTWEDKNTKEKRSRMKVVVDQFQFLGGKGDSAPAQPAEHPAPAAQPAPRSFADYPRPAKPQEPGAMANPVPKPSPGAGNLDEDVPFAK